VFNTISNVTAQDGQVDVFCNAAAYLRQGGVARMGGVREE
jgi:hypothetical protein